jgi:hypothetical protein
MTRNSRWTYFLICSALALLLAVPMTVEARRGRSSNFLMTPNGPVPRSVMYGAYMTPQQVAASQKAEQAEYEQILKAQNPEMYKQYMANKKSSSGSTKKK